jgi:hypothetical protein
MIARDDRPRRSGDRADQYRQTKNDLGKASEHIDVADSADLPAFARRATGHLPYRAELRLRRGLSCEQQTAEESKRARGVAHGPSDERGASTAHALER